MKKIGLITLVTLSAISLIGCSRAQNYADPSKTIHVNTNQQFTLALAANSGSTGYIWEESHDTTMLQLVSRDYKVNKEPPGFVGGGGTELITYKALKKGKTVVTLIYQQPWEQPGPTNKTEIFTVDIP